MEDNANNETGFKIDRATSSDFTQNLVTTTVGTGVTSYAYTGLSASTTYYYRVRATNSAGDSANTTAVSATTFGTASQGPEVVGVHVGGSAWTSVSLAGGYSIPVGSGAQLLPLPWEGINQIQVTFNENVTVNQSDLLLTGVNVPSYNVAAARSATIRPPSPPPGPCRSRSETTS